ncbi:biopolymer transporter ExbB [Pseudohalocynthiibacter aestuariivivens]|uniref:Biopolymer transporter ExbB n=1 Tax=Pseudohalocynthiibacter aestuariivivens TaxID=1591409 RepID=A0ABV5JDT3_9RHOB|nr:MULTISPECIES: biopolymer transporter ExbB [Pseudohalocynthiibacter]MBS9717220.1 biopolymer transporter ExbB [Pseudohalocynthiibacter aestuariivivens]MCK0103676.1 biopolymer transporter ExbB [Pseudohalocynthiibacter sp. F2068]
MGHPDREAEPYFTQPVRQIMTMLIVLGLVGLGAYVAFPKVAPVFLANPYLNGFILFVFVIGVFACFWQVAQLVSSVGWIEGFAAQRLGHEMTKAPRLLASLAGLLRSRGTRVQISSSSSASILDSVATRIDEARDITRYIVNLLIFLGLLGTFYGLATTVPALVETIKSLAPQDSEGGIEVFGRLMSGLEAQLGGMGTAFASSLLGLAGSLVVGLLELFAGHGQNRFYRELEEWLSTITRVGFSTGETEGSGEHGQVAVVLDEMSRQMEAMQEMFGQSDASRTSLDEQLGKLVKSVEKMAETAGKGQSGTETVIQALGQVAEGQARLINTIEASLEEGGGAHVDAESRMRLRSIDVQLLRILEEISAGRQESTAELRGELAQLNRTIRELSTEQEQG